MLYAAHSGIRYLVLAAGVAVVLFALYGFLRSRAYAPAMARLSATFAGLLHLQILIGLATLLSRPFHTRLIGHILAMLAAAAVAQLVGSVMKRRPEEERSYLPHLVSALVALALVAAGIHALGRGVLQSTL